MSEGNRPKSLARIDGNSFYCSCERVFNCDVPDYTSVIGRFGEAQDWRDRASR